MSRLLLLSVLLTAFFHVASFSLRAAEGTLTVGAIDEDSGEPIIARIELTRPTLLRGNRPASRRDRFRVVKPLPGRTSTETGFGFVIDAAEKLNLSEGPYEFRLSRGPEYRVLTGNFSIEKTSRDETTFAIPRMLPMREHGWTSGDCFVPASRESLPLRMSAEDLHVAIVSDDSKITQPEVDELRAQRTRRQRANLVDPLWVDARVRAVGGLALFDWQATTSPSENENNSEAAGDLVALSNLSQIVESRQQEVSVAAPPQPAVKVAIEDPFAWALPVYLASDQIDCFFLLGDWLRLDRPLLQTKTGRPFSTDSNRAATQLGREAEQIYWNTLDAGFRLAPLAGSGDEGGLHPVGYNRLYVAGESAGHAIEKRKPVSTARQWWEGAWAGRSFVTNGPLLIASLDGQAPGHVFETSAENPLSLTPELTLTVRDPVEYLEVIYNGQIHYSAKLDEYARAGGRIPALRANQSGWVLIRVVTLHEGHFRAASTAPWYIEVDGQQRVSQRGVEFFQTWLADYEGYLKTHAGSELMSYAPYIRAARAFWEARRAAANDR